MPLNRLIRRALEGVGGPALVSALVSALLLACGPGYGTGTYDASDVEVGLAEDGGLIVGDFPLRPKGVVDGDTVKVGGLKASLRLLGMDTEETFKSEGDRRAYETGWENYLQLKASKTNRPIKVATPLGEEAKVWAKQFFSGVTTVRLERDHPGEIRGRFNRFLVYVLVKQDDQWVNYNVEAVRAGMSPYFVKYGYSRRFHKEFVSAQLEARQARRGIWDPKKQHYRDYDARLSWWESRAKFVTGFERQAETRDDVVLLTRWNALRKLEQRVGQVTTVVATVGEIHKREKGPSRVMLSRRMFSDFPVVFHDPFVLEDSQIEKWRGEYVAVRGKVNQWTNPRNGRTVLQVRVDQAAQVVVPSYTPPGSQPEQVEPSPAGQKEKKP